MRAAVLLLPLALAAQIDTSVIDKHRAALEKQAADPEMQRKGGTQPQDWPYRLPEGVRTRDVTFYSDGTACHAKLFLPRGFSPRGKFAGVVLGHGFNAISIGIEKYGARFAERGLVAMVIDYRTYGFSSGQPMLLDDDTSNDTRPVWEREGRVRVKRTRLHHFRQIEDYRAAISFLRGEPGVDPERIGIWGSSNSGGEVITVAGRDARVKAVVAQVIGVGGRGASGPAPLAEKLVNDAIQRARTGQGGEVDGGFSFRTKIDVETTQTGREHRPWAALARIPSTTAILWIPAEKDELAPPRSPSGPYEAAKAFAGVSQVAEIPFITHFQAYSGPAFEVSSTLAADWFLKYLAAPKPAPAPPRPELPPIPAPPAPLKAMPEGVTARDVWYYSEAVKCYGRLFLPKDFSTSGRTAGVVVAPDWGQTHDAVLGHAAALAARGLAALAIDYRSWGRSGAYVYVNDPVHQDDRFRFLEVTARVTLRRKRLLPQDQVEDIRNALSFLQGEPGIDPGRVGLWGSGTAAGHLFTVAATDARVKALVGLSPWAPGKDVPPAAVAAPAAATLLARSGLGAGPQDTQVALAEYLPFHALAEIPDGVAVAVTGPRAAEIAAKLKGGAAQPPAAAEAAAWIAGKLK